MAEPTNVGHSTCGMTDVGPVSATEASALVRAGIMRLEDFGPHDQPSRVEVSRALAQGQNEEATDGR